MAESLHVNVFDEYKGCELMCSVKAYNESRLVHSWHVDDPRATVHQGIDATNDSVFDKVRMKQHIDKVFDLFEPKKIVIEGK